MDHAANGSRYHASGTSWFLLTCECFATHLILLIAPGASGNSRGGASGPELPVVVSFSPDENHPSLASHSQSISVGPTHNTVSEKRARGNGSTPVRISGSGSRLAGTLGKKLLGTTPGLGQGLRKDASFAPSRTPPVDAGQEVAYVAIHWQLSFTFCNTIAISEVRRNTSHCTNLVTKNVPLT